MACDINGEGFSDIACAPGPINKNGDGKAIVALSEGAYKIDMNGGAKGRMYLIGRQDYRTITGDKNGECALIWVPNDDTKPAFGPNIGNHDGKGKIRMGTWAEVAAERKAASSTS